MSLKRARTQAVWLMENCPNPDCPIGCPDEHADLGYPEVNCATFRPPELIPIGGAHPDAWRCLFQPRGLRLYVAGTLAIMAPDPDSAWRMLAGRLPTVAELTASDPDFTGGLSTEDYVRRLRQKAKAPPKRG